MRSSSPGEPKSRVQEGPVERSRVGLVVVTFRVRAPEAASTAYPEFARQMVSSNPRSNPGACAGVVANARMESRGRARCREYAAQCVVPADCFVGDDCLVQLWGCVPTQLWQMPTRPDTKGIPPMK